MWGYQEEKRERESSQNDVGVSQGYFCSSLWGKVTFFFLEMRVGKWGPDLSAAKNVRPRYLVLHCLRRQKKVVEISRKTPSYAIPHCLKGKKSNRKKNV